MGVRLYPNTKNVVNLEILAGVPAGTAQKLEQLQSEFQCPEDADFYTRRSLDDGFYEELFLPENADLNNYHSFLLFGWGKFDDCGLALECAGSFTNEANIRHLFNRNGIRADISLCEGVHWC